MTRRPFAALIALSAFLSAHASAQEPPRGGHAIDPPPPVGMLDKNDAYYAQRLLVDVAGGRIVVKAAADVRPAALLAARRTMLAMLADADEAIARRVADSGLEVVIIPEFRRIIHLPEFRHLAGQKLPDGRLFDDVRGVTAILNWQTPIVACSEENILRILTTVQSTMHHEFGHAVQLAGLSANDRQRWRDLYADAQKRGLFAKKYAMSNEREFFAELTEAYFGMTPYFCSRDQLARVDPPAFAFLARVYSAKKLRPSTPPKAKEPAPEAGTTSR